MTRRVRRITVRGALNGAQGGEPIVVSARNARSTRWTEQVVTAGANGGRFTATFNVRGRPSSSPAGPATPAARARARLC